ncbi:MAG: alpha/beta hydrolase family protein [Chloroflexota bacterium]
MRSSFKATPIINEPDPIIGEIALEKSFVIEWTLMHQTTQPQNVNPYHYQDNKPQVNLHLKKTTGKWQQYRVDFPSAFPARYITSDTVRGEYYQPSCCEPAPLTILTHGMGDPSAIPCHLLARSLVRQGIACFVLYLPLHSSRIPEDIKRRLPDLTADEWFEAYQISVINLRQVLDWAGRQPELNKDQIATFGISLGGFVSGIAMGLEKRIKAGVFTVTGGNSEKMMWLSKTRAYRNGYQRTEAEYREIQSRYLYYLTEVEKDGFENVIPPRQSFLTDPMTFAGYLRGRPVLMLNARWDKYIPGEAVFDFWHACGQPQIKWFPTGHASIWLYYPLIRHTITVFLKSNLTTSSSCGLK